MKMAYISHPFSGNEEENRADAMRITQEFAHRDSERTLYINPIEVFTAAAAAGLSYDAIMNQCLELLSRCDALIMCEGWESSKGCWAEYAFAKAKGMKIIYLEE